MGHPSGMDASTVGESDRPRQPNDPLPTPTAVPRLELRNISKSFGGVRVLSDVDFHLASGEVVGLLGDNGAGKSTLIKIVTGVHRPDAGEILFGGGIFAIFR